MYTRERERERERESVFMCVCERESACISLLRCFAFTSAPYMDMKIFLSYVFSPHFASPLPFKSIGECYYYYYLAYMAEQQQSHLKQTTRLFFTLNVKHEIWITEKMKKILNLLKNPELLLLQYFFQYKVISLQVSRFEFHSISPIRIKNQNTFLAQSY